MVNMLRDLMKKNGQYARTEYKESKDENSKSKMEML